jgi:hypothetical protein
MLKTQNMLLAVICLLLVVIAGLLYDRHQRQETLGEKIGQSIDRATQQFGNAIDESTKPPPPRRYNP